LRNIAHIAGAGNAVIAEGVVRGIEAIGCVAYIIGAGDAVIAIQIADALRAGGKGKNNTSKQQYEGDGFHDELVLGRERALTKCMKFYSPVQVVL